MSPEPSNDHRDRQEKVRGRFLAALLTLFALPTYASAHEEIRQSELLLFEEPVISSASKRAQPMDEAPSSVTVVTHEEIRRFGYRTLADLLRAQRGFYTSYDYNYEYVGVRGFLRQGDYNDRILLLVNGHTYNDDIYQMGFVGNDFGIDLELVERVEIVRGPGSALYGANAIFAVVNVVTKDPAAAGESTAVAETGSYGRKRAHLSGGRTFANGLSVLAGASALDLDGHEEIRFRDLDGPERSFGIARDADGEQVVRFFLSAKWGRFALQGGASHREKEVPTGAYGTLVGDPATRTVDRRAFAEVAFASPIGAGFELASRLYYDGYEYHGDYVSGLGDDRSVFHDESVSHWLGGEARLLREIFAGNRIVLGGEYSYHPRARQESKDETGIVFVDSRSFGNYGIYLQDEWDVRDSLRLIAGVRLDEAYADEREATPRAGVIWTPWVETRLKLLYGRAFRPPNLYEKYYYDGSSELRREQATTYEGVYEQELGGFTAIASVFHYEVEDLIDLVDDESMGLTFANRDRAQATGGELELRAELAAGVTGRASYSLQHVSVGGQRATNSPRHLASVGLLFEPLSWLRGGAEVLVVGPRRTLAGRVVDTAVVPNLTFVARTPIHGLDAEIGLYNFLGQPYSDPAGAEHDQDRIPRDRFNFRFALRYSF